MSSAQLFSEGIGRLSSENKKKLQDLQRRVQQLASLNPPRTRRNLPRTRRNQQQNQRIPSTREEIINFLNSLPISDHVIPDAENSITYEPISDNDEIFILDGLKQYPYKKDTITQLLLEPNPFNPFTRKPITKGSITKYRLRNPLNNKTIGGRKKTHKKSHKTHKKSKRN